MSTNCMIMGIIQLKTLMRGQCLCILIPFRAAGPVKSFDSLTMLLKTLQILNFDLFHKIFHFKYMQRPIVKSKSGSDNECGHYLCFKAQNYCSSQ